MGGKGGRGREGMTHSNCILESACKRIKRQRKKKEYEMYKTESQNSERTGWVPERPEPSIATKKNKNFSMLKKENQSILTEENRISKCTVRKQQRSSSTLLENFKIRKKRSSTDVVEPVGSPLRNQIFLVF